MLLSIQEIFPALDTAVVQSIYTNKFQAANFLKLEDSFTYKKKRPQFYSFGTGEASLNLSTTCKDVDLEEYEPISHLMRAFMVYSVIICTFAPPSQKLPLAFAIMTYAHTLYEHLHTHKCRLPNGPGRLASFRAPNDGPVRGMHFGGLVRPGTESEYLAPDIDDCSLRIRF